VYENEHGRTWKYKVVRLQIVYGWTDIHLAIKKQEKLDSKQSRVEV